MIVELFFAALMGFVWAYTGDNLIHKLAYNAMFIASVSTVIFNANPLLRYDGYYILSDWLEIPNLRQKSTEYALGLIKRHIFRLKLQQPLPPAGQRGWLLSYAIASSIYRVFVGIMIILVVTFKVPILGVLMAMGGVVTWLGVPVYQVAKYLMLEPELHRKRIRAAFFSATVAATAVILIGLIPFPVHVQFAGILRPEDDESSGMLHSQVDGFVDTIPVHDGQWVEAGQVILTCHDPRVDTDVDIARHSLQELQLRERQSRATDLIQYQKDLADEKVWQAKLAEAQDRQEKMIVKAPFAGMLIAPQLDRMPGVFLSRGQEIGVVAALRTLVVHGDVEQTDSELVQKQGNLHPEIRLAGMLSQTLSGPGVVGDVVVLPAASRQLAHASMGSEGGGDIPTDPRDPKHMTAQGGQFEVHVKLANPDLKYCAGQRAYVQLTLDQKPLIWQWTRKFMQLIQAHDNGKWL